MRDDPNNGCEGDYLLMNLNAFCLQCVTNFILEWNLRFNKYFQKPKKKSAELSKMLIQLDANHTMVGTATGRRFCWSRSRKNGANQQIIPITFA